MLIILKLLIVTVDRTARRRSRCLTAALGFAEPKDEDEEEEKIVEEEVEQCIM